MAYVSPNGTTTQSVALDVSGFADLPETRKDRLLRQAHRAVLDLAPPPAVPAPEHYRETARDAEVALVEYAVETQGGIVKSESLSGVASTSYDTGSETVQSIVRNAMGRYFEQPQAATPRLA